MSPCGPIVENTTTVICFAGWEATIALYPLIWGLLPTQPSPTMTPIP
jgi:hypothetical protein